MSNSNDPVKITALLEDLKSQDPKCKVEAVKNLHIISQALGKERSRNELIPYVTGNI